MAGEEQGPSFSSALIENESMWQEENARVGAAGGLQTIGADGGAARSLLPPNLAS